MKESAKADKKRGPIRRIMRWVVLGAAMLAVLLTALAALLPTLVSTGWGNRFIEAHISAALKRPVHLGRVAWGWRDGLRIADVRLPDDPRFSNQNLLYVRDLRLRIFWRDLMEKRLNVAFQLRGLNASIVRTGDGKTNLDQWLQTAAGDNGRKSAAPDRHPRAHKAEPGSGVEPAALFLDVRSRIQLSDITLTLYDRLSGKTVALRQSRFDMNMPSLLTAPVLLEASTAVELDGDRLPASQLKLRLNHLFDARAHLNPAGVRVDLDARLPGIHAVLKGGLEKTAVEGRIDILPAEVLAVAGPFLPPALVPSNVKGRLKIRFNGLTESENSIAFVLGVKALGFGFSNGPLAGKTLAPLDVDFSQKGRVDMAAKTLFLDQGGFSFQGQNNVHWQGRIMEVFGGGDERAVDLKIRAALDPGQMLYLARPFMPPSMETAAIEGWMTAAVSVSGALSKDLVFDILLAGTSLQFSGGPLNDKTVGPVSVELTNRGRFDAAGRLTVDSGALALAPDSRLAFSGVFSGIGGESLAIDALHMDMDLNLQTITLLAADFMPPEVEWGPKASSRLKIASFSLSGRLPQGSGEAGFERLVLTLPKVSYTSETRRVRLNGFECHLADLIVRADRRFPRHLQLTAGLDIDALEVNFGRMVRLDRLKLPALHLKATHIRPDATAMGGVSARIHLAESAAIDRLAVPGTALVETLTHALDIQVDLLSGGGLKMMLPELALSTAAVHFAHPSIGSLQTDLLFNAAVSQSTLMGIQPLRLDAEGCRAALRIGRMFDLNAAFDLKDSGRQTLDTNGALKVNLAELPQLSTPAALLPTNLSGTAAVNWSMKGRRPDAVQIEALRSLPPDIVRRSTEFLDQLEISLALTDIGAALHLADNTVLVLPQLSTPDPIRYALNPHSGRGVFGGAVHLAGFDPSPFKALPATAPLDIDLSFALQHEFLEHLDVSQTLTVNPFKVKQTLMLSLAGLNRLLAAPGSDLRRKIIEHLTCEGRVSLDIGDLSGLAPLVEDLMMDGALSTALNIDWKPGEKLRTGAGMQIPRLDLRLGDDIRLDQLTADLEVARAYALTAAAVATLDEAERQWIPLSVRVLEAQQTPGAAWRFETRPEWGGRSPGLPFVQQPSVSWDMVDISSTPLPLRLEHGRAALDLNRGGLPHIDFFQVDVLGGTLQGRLSIDKGRSAFWLTLETAFSGLDGNTVLPADVKADAGDDGDLSGRLRLALPLSMKMADILQDLQIDASLDHIGPRALERLLFALDPYESNEAIVSQRRLLQTGTPRWVRLTVRDGAFSLGGELTVKGVPLDLPALDRINLTTIAGLDRYEVYLSRLAPLTTLLQYAAADRLMVGGK